MIRPPHFRVAIHHASLIYGVAYITHQDFAGRLTLHPPNFSHDLGRPISPEPYNPEICKFDLAQPDSQLTLGAVHNFLVQNLGVHL